MQGLSNSRLNSDNIILPQEPHFAGSSKNKKSNLVVLKSRKRHKPYRVVFLLVIFCALLILFLTVPGKDGNTPLSRLQEFMADITGNNTYNTSSTKKQQDKYLPKQKLIEKASLANLSKAEDAISQKKWKDAENYLSLIPEGTPYFDRAQQLLDKTRRMINSEESFKAGMDCYKKNEWDTAQLLLSQVEEDDDNYAEARQIIQKINFRRAERYLSEQGAGKAVSSPASRGSLKSEPVSGTSALTQTESDSFSEIDMIKDGAKKFTYEELMESGMQLSGQRIKLKCKVVDVKPGSSLFIAFMTEKDRVWSDMIAVFYYGSVEIEKGNVVNIWGKVRGLHEIQPATGNLQQLPCIDAELIE